MSEPVVFRFLGRPARRKSSRRASRSQSIAACVEQLEDRRVLAVITPVLAVTQFNDPTVEAVNALPGGDLNVASTAGFTPTGSLFVQTTTGVATVQYTGTTSTSFTGCTVSTTDPFHVGADDTIGHLDKVNGVRAVFQATTQTFQITIPNQTGASVSLDYSVVWSSAGVDNDATNYFTLDSGGAFENLSSLGNNTTLPAFSVAASGGTTTISLPYLPINSARVYLFAGSTSPISAQFANGQWGYSAPTPSSYPGIYDYFEINLNASGVNSTVQSPAVQNLPTLTIDTSQVDQFGIPMTLNGSSDNGAGTTQLTSGVTDSPAVARDAIISQFQALHPAGSDPYAELVLPVTSQSQGLPLRILNPGKASITNTDPLGYVFDGEIQKLFETSAGNLTLTQGGNTYTVTPATVTDSASHVYNVLKITGSGLVDANGATTPAYIYEPFFSTNAPAPASLSPVDYTGRPPAPTWLSNANETPGQMVFGNDGVFTDAGTQVLPSGVKYSGATVGIVAGLENQIVAALNRGVATKYNDTADWQNPNNFYPSGQTYNQYAQFLHQQTINGTPIMIDGLAYAIPFDDQGGLSTTLTLLDQASVSVTLGPWTNSIENNRFVVALYHDVLNRAPDTEGNTFWLTALNDGTSRQQVSLEFVDSLEHRADLIQGFYTSLLGRSGSSQEIGYYLKMFEDGWTESQVKSCFYASDEYYQTRGGGTNSGFVDALYHDELGRAPDSQAQVAIATMLAAGQSRSDVAAMVAGSPESETDRVRAYFLAYLLRPADAAGLVYWATILATTGRDGDVESGLLGSAEFYALP